MMHYINGDLTDATQDVIAHGVNCTGHFGSGVAGAIKEKHPYVRNQYLNLQMHELGTCQFVEYDNRIWVNAHTQQNKGYDGKVYASLNAIGCCFAEIADYMEENDLTTLAIPKIGCGLGGLDWNDVSILIDGIFNNIDVYVYEM